MKILLTYLHFYIGCDIEVRDEKYINNGIVVGKLRGMQYDRPLVEFLGSDGYEDINSCKPILRSLHDMTDFEALAIYNTAWPNHMINNDKKINHVRELFLSEDIEYPTGGLLGNMPVILLCLGQGFDLFGLIDAGLAHNEKMYSKQEVLMQKQKP